MTPAEARGTSTSTSGAVPDSTGAMWTILSVTALSAFMSALDVNIVALALPKIAHELTAGVSLLGWVVTGYILASVTLLLQAGRTGDRYGRKRIYLVGFAVFGFASALCGLSQSISELILFRVLQGVGASMLQATNSPLVFESFPPRMRGTALGIIATTWAVGAVTGPALGGFLVALDWRLIFYVNVPIAAAGVLVGAKVIPSRKLHAATLGGFNLLNSALLGVTVGTTLTALTFFDLRFAVVGLFSFLGLVIVEWRSSNPILSVELRRNRALVLTFIVLGLSQIGYLGIPFALSLYFQGVLAFSSVTAGLLITPLSIALVLSNPSAGRLFDRLRRPAFLTLAGVSVDGVAIIGLAAAIAGSASPYTVSLLLVVIGLGQGFVWTPMISSMLRFAAQELRGLANGTALTLVNIGYGSSIGIIIAVSAALLPHQVVSEIYLGNFAALSSIQAGLFRTGIASAVYTLGAVNLLVLPFVFLVLREQKK